MLAIGSVAGGASAGDRRRAYRTAGTSGIFAYVVGVLVLLYSMLADHASRVQSLVGIESSCSVPACKRKRGNKEDCPAEALRGTDAPTGP